MHQFTAQHPEKGEITYQDRKRYLWLVSLLYPLIALSGIGLYYLTGSQWLFVVPLIASYIGVSALDWLLGEDRNNPPEELVPQLEADAYYRWLPILTVPMHVLVLVIFAWFISSHDLGLPALIMLTLTAGLYSGLGINTAHELGHKKPALERWMARIALAVSGYGHFCVEHNRGHHRHVATPEDPASSKMGENIYQFACKEIPAGFRRGWQCEKERMQRQGNSVWHPSNEVLQSYALTLVIQGALIVAFGWLMLPFLLVQNFFGWWQLTSANYIEHYGLLRQRKPNGGYEHCQPWHSWNADYIASNLLLFQLERHSDHHANPTRRYQSLRSFANLPTLPTGYSGMYAIAMLPALWYRVMDKRVLALPHIAGNFDKVNIAPGRRAELEARYARVSCRPHAAQEA
jgi:alkane 1-monooxygenase